jgi:phosphodiesterase/alkaline phosphatase D-like protein
MNMKNTIRSYSFGAITIAIAAAFLGSSVTLAASPSVITTGSPTVSSTTATISGAYNTNLTRQGVDARFDWGTSNALGNSTTFVTYPASSGNFNTTLTGLSPSTTYYYRAFVSNSTTGPGYGTILPFTTTSGVAAMPGVITSSQTHTANTATLTGSFSASGAGSTEVEFVWGTSSAVLTNSTGFMSRSGSVGSFSADLTGLSPSTTYYFRAVARNSGGTTYATQILPLTTSAGNTQTSCSLSSFTSSSYSVTSGSSVTLSWNGSNCSSFSISPSIGTLSGSTNSVVTGAINSLTTYTITGYGSGAPIVLSTTIVISGGGLSGTPCTISSFYASPATVAYGASTTFSWNMNSSCTNPYLSDGMGSVATSGSYTTGGLVGSAYYSINAIDSTTGLLITNRIFVAVTTSGGGSFTPCTIASFTVYPLTVTSGQSATLSWTTNGCQSANISGGSLYGQYASSSGTMNTGALSGTTTFTLLANGSGTTSSQSTAVSVINSPYPFSYTCQDGIYSSDPSCNSHYSGNFVTTPAANVGGTTARLNGLALNTADNFAAYFEYGTTPSLGRATVFQSLGNVTAFNVIQDINVSPNTTYYYRLVAQITGGATVRGNILSFTTKSADTVSYANNTTYTNDYSYTSTTTDTTATTAANHAAASGVIVNMINQGDKVQIGDIAEYTVTYTNGLGKTLKDAVLTIVLPQGFVLKQTTQGIMLNPTTVSVTLGTLVAGQTGSVFIQAAVGPNAMTNTTLVTSATLAYTLPNGMHDSSVGYVLNHVNPSTTFTGFAFGSGFFPTTIFGWLITIIIILTIILLARRIAKEKKAGQGHGGAHH